MSQLYLIFEEYFLNNFLRVHSHTFDHKYIYINLLISLFHNINIKLTID